MDKNTRTSIKWTLIILVIGGLLYFFYPVYRAVTIFGDVKAELKDIECFGTITAVTETQPCFSTITVTQKNERVDLTICTCGLTSDFWSYAKTGDQIEKKKGQLTVTIISQSTGEEKEFEYPYCLH